MVERKALQAMIDEGLTIRAMAARSRVSYTTIRYWLQRHGLQTPRGLRLEQTRAARDAGSTGVVAFCPVHGSTQLVPRPGGGFRCLRCRNDAVLARRRRVKAILVADAGGACALCGYDRTTAALQFHHVDPAAKSFGIAGAGMARSLARARAEAAKCVLLCANCHAEVEVGALEVPFSITPVQPGDADPR